MTDGADLEAPASTTVRATAGGRDEGGGPDLMELSAARFEGLEVFVEATDEPDMVTLSTADVTS